MPRWLGFSQVEQAWVAFFLRLLGKEQAGKVSEVARSPL